jgi:hypothetical protein
MSRDVPFQHLKLISSKAFEVCRPSKPCPLLTMFQLIDSEQESEDDAAQLFLTLIHVKRKSQPQKSCGDGRATKEQVWMHWEL